MRHILRLFIAVFFTAVLAFSPGSAPAAGPETPDGGAAKLDAAQLEQLAAPVALYPDALLAQVLMASTYPLEVVDAARWARDNSGLKDAELDAALQKQNWDPSVMSLVKVPQTLQMMNEKLDWTEKLGDAYLAQPKDLMDAVQHLRAKAEAQGNLKSNKQQTVKVDGGSGANTIIIEQAQPDVIYVPTYNPTIVYGPWPYPAYPPYSWYPPGYVAGASIISFGVGLAVGYSMWGYPDWHSGDVHIDVDHYTHFSGHPPPPPPPHGGGGHPPPPPHGGMRPGGDVWSHNPDHRGNVPYRNSGVAERFQKAKQSGLSPAEQRVRAREVFRGHGPAMQGGSGAAGYGIAGHMEGRGTHPGREGGMRHMTGEGIGHSGGLPSGGHSFQGHSGGRPSLFSGGGGHGARHEFQRGSQSRQIMHSHPRGGGFHGGGFHRR